MDKDVDVQSASSNIHAADSSHIADEAIVAEIGDLQQCLTRISDFIKQSNFSDAQILCDQALKIYLYNEKLQEKKIKIFRHQGKFHEAYSVAQDWYARDPKNATALKELKRLKVVIQALNDQDDESEEDIMEYPELPPKDFALVSSPVPHKEYLCTFCNLTFHMQEELDSHCRGDSHQKRLTSDEKLDWKYRRPPRGLSSEEFTLCKGYNETGKCAFGDKCTQAHSQQELLEWKDRFKFRKQQIKFARDKHLHGNSYADVIMEKLVNTENPKSVMVSNVDYAKVRVNSDLKVKMTAKKCTSAWTFTITSKKSLHTVALLDDTNRTYFYIASISVGPKKTQKYQTLEAHCQEWSNPDFTGRILGEYVYRVKVVFKTDIYGTFRQTLIMDFGVQPALIRELHVDSSPIIDTDKVYKDILLKDKERWRRETVDLVNFSPVPIPKLPIEEKLLSKYSLPDANKFHPSQHLMHSASKESYRIWMHEMLYLEEWAQLEAIGRYHVKACLQLVNRFLLIPGVVSGAKYAPEGELFARMTLQDRLSEDTAAGRLILSNCHTAWITPDTSKKDDKKKLRVYEAIVEDKGRNFVFLRLSKECVEELCLNANQDFHAQVQFQLNRLPMCEMHAAIDNIHSLDIVFPSHHNSMKKNWTSKDFDFCELVSPSLNLMQKVAIKTITAERKEPIPPILLVGPYGTGKTFTLAQATKEALQQEDCRVLICTHSNSAADLYIKEFLHSLVKEGYLEAKPLRVYYRHRWVQTVPEIVLQYCLRETEADKGNFRLPTLEDMENHKIIITTLGTARYLCDLNLPKDFFSHIYLDEAAQAMETEALIPLSLAGPLTRIILCGDHMQISPEIMSPFGRQQGFHKSMVERLYELYPDDSECCVMLTDNYRSHSAIIDFTSELFYDSQLRTAGEQPPHPMYYPLTFYSTRGEEVQHENSTGFYNISEVYEVIDRVDDLIRNWPTSEWGEVSEDSVGVLAPYTDQVFHIRSELRKRKMFNVSVERIFNVQGKQFRAVILSTVRTRHTCSSDTTQEDVMDYGFLSNVKLLNTAITRAQSLVIVVGDPLSLCLVGKCRKVWEHFLDVCKENNSLFGITWARLQAQLNTAEVRKTYVLNPLAPEFVPNRLYHVTAPDLHQIGSQAGPQHQQPQHPGYYMGPRVMYPRGPVYVEPSQTMPAPLYPVPIAGYAQPQMLYRGPHPHILAGPGKIPSRPNLRQSNPVQGGVIPPKVKGHSSVGTAGAAGLSEKDVKLSQKVAAGATGRQLVYFPRVPQAQLYPQLFYYPSQMAQGGYYYYPEDPRLMMSQHLLPAYLPAQVPVPGAYPIPRAALATEGLVENEEKRVLSTSPNTAVTGSPSGSPGLGSGATGGLVGPGQNIQLLPGARHIPQHLIPASVSRTGTPNGSSRSSTPQQSRTESPHLYQQYDIEKMLPQKIEEEYRKSASPSLVEQHEARSNSPLARVIRQKMASSAAEMDMSTLAQQSKVFEENFRSIGKEDPSMMLDFPERSQRARPSLRLTTARPGQTGFSRQFSEDLETPKEIKDLVRMLDEPLEKHEESLEDDSLEGQSPASEASSSLRPVSSSSSALKRGSRNLHLIIPAHDSNLEEMSPPSGDSKEDSATYAGAVRKKTSTDTPEYDTSLRILEPKTPHTPVGFVTPSEESVDTDPLGILRNLNINASDSHKHYKYFS